MLRYSNALIQPKSQTSFGKSATCPTWFIKTFFTSDRNWNTTDRTQIVVECINCKAAKTETITISIYLDGKHLNFGKIVKNKNQNQPELNGKRWIGTKAILHAARCKGCKDQWGTTDAIREPTASRSEAIVIQVTGSAAAVLPESPAHSARSWCSWRVGPTDSWTSVMGYSYALSHTRIKHTTLLSNKNFTYSFNNTRPQIGMWMYTVEWIPCQKSLFVHKTCWLYNCIIFSGGRSGPPIQSVLLIPSWQWAK